MKQLPDIPTGQQITEHVKKTVQEALNEREYANQLQPSPVLAHDHDGANSSPINQNDVQNGPKGFGQQYYAREYDNGKVTTTAIINWAFGNVQYITLTGNTTFIFRNGQAGMRAILQVAGAFTPTWPGTVRWPGGSTPTATATAGHKDIYSFVYSGKEGLYDGVQAANFATT